MEIITQLTINSIIAASLYAMVAIGFNLIYRATKFFNLAHGALVAVGGYTVFYLADSLHINIFASIVLGVIAAGIVGYITDKIVYLPLRKRKATNMVKLVASLGIFTAMQALLAIFFGSQIQTLIRFAHQPKVYNIFGAAITDIQLIIIGTTVVVCAALIYFINKTIFGKAVKAISDDEEVAKVVGINTNKIIGFVFFIGSAIAGIAGIMVGFDTGIQPTMGLFLLLRGIVAAIVGGAGNLYGAIIGSVLLGVAENFGSFHLSGEWKEMIAFILLIVFLIFRPRGIMNK